jgi:hypothetical protein
MKAAIETSVAEIHIPTVAFGRQARTLLAKPRCCAHEGKCCNLVRFSIDGDYFCQKHSDLWWESHYVENHRVSRVGSRSYDF